jgi:two-component system, OmpR family, phosphate regulon sensor histidine kinase PhoR
MKLNRLNIIIFLGLIAIAGILVIQLYLLRQAVKQEENTFEQKARLALLEVAKRLYQDKKQELPELNPVKEVSEDHYIVNINREFTANVLEFYLRSELAKFGLITDFEYAMYNCETDDMVYGNYVSFTQSEKNPDIKAFPRQSNLVYYFVIRFPQKTSLVYSSLWIWIIFSVVMFFVLVIYSYSALKLLKQKKYSELQRDFINNMTHEFKTPLSSILLSSGFLARQPAIDDDEKMKKYTGIITEQANKLNAHVEKVLDLARAENNLFKIQSVDTDASAIIYEVINSVNLKYPEAIISFDHGNEPVTLNADPFHFYNLVYNIVDNSVKYSRIEPRVSIKLTEEIKHLQLSITDEGPGIARKHLENIFDKFYRVPGKASTEVPGFGLGLFYVKKICDAHKWKITASSDGHSGTNLTILIPKA